MPHAANCIAPIIKITGQRLAKDVMAFAITVKRGTIPLYMHSRAVVFVLPISLSLMSAIHVRQVCVQAEFTAIISEGLLFSNRWKFIFMAHMLPSVDFMALRTLDFTDLVLGA